MRLGPALLATLLGASAGLGAYTFLYARGYSYLSNDPAACTNCHLMREQFDSWQKSAHHGRATCNDCHTPHALPPKLLIKGENGWRHSLHFTLQDFAEPVRIKADGRATVEANCIRCHLEMVSQMSGLECLHCHAGVIHGPGR